MKRMRRADLILEKQTRAFVRAVFLAVLQAVGPKREDGFPLCPGCGEDWLFPGGATWAEIRGCDKCGWRLD